MSPENLLCNPGIRRMLHSSVYQQNLVAFIVDEAHPMYENVVCFTAYNEVLLFSECSSNDEFEDDK